MCVCVCVTQVEDDPTGGKLASTSGKLNGAPHKVAAVSNFHVGDTITAMQRAAMQPGGQEVRAMHRPSSARMFVWLFVLFYTPA